MLGTLITVFVVAAVLAVIGIVVFATYRKLLRRAKGIERGLKMVPLLIHLPPIEVAGESSRDEREVMREKISQGEALYDLIAGTATNGFKSKFYGQRHIALELVARNGAINYYAAVPVALVSVIVQAIQTAYPGAKIEETEDYNIFNQQARIAGVSGGELVLKAAASYPIATFEKLERDPMEAIINSLGNLNAGEGAAVQILLRPASPDWLKTAARLAKSKRTKGATDLSFTAMDLAKAAVKAPSVEKAGEAKELTGIEQAAVEGIEQKAQRAGYETLVRVVTSAADATRSQAILRDIVAAFALFDAPGSNGFKYIPAGDLEGLVTAFIFRFFPPELNRDVLNSQELATVFHLPQAHVTATAQVQRQASKEIDAPPNLPADGLILGYNEFRGQRREVRLTANDRRRHTYIVGQTGTGKSTMLENLAVQDMLAGGGFAFIDPHGDTAERLLSMVPKNRTEDIIYFNPGDTEHPLGLNLFEFTDPAQKDFLIQESINMLYKIYDPNATGVIGPRFEQWFRNAALTLMSDPNGATFIEIPKVFTDAEYLKQKFKYLTDPTVIEFWTKEMGQTSDYHKSEMLGYFVSKFGAFMQNEIMRNIMGQTKSAFNLRDIMDNKKILIVNLSKGNLGELNAKLLGMIFVIKFQAAAMSRANVPEEQRQDFCLYVDEFQNFSTDSFASILSEARKYRLNLIVANQFIGQLSDAIRDAVFGNVGSIASYRAGPDDADFLVKQFAPAFDQHDIVNIPNYHAIVRLMVGGLPTQPFSLTALPPLGIANAELGLAVKQLSAAKFGATKAQVEADLFARLGGQGTGNRDQGLGDNLATKEPDLSTVINSDASTAQVTPPPQSPTPAPITPAASPVAAPPIAPPPAVPPPGAQPDPLTTLSIKNLTNPMLPPAPISNTPASNETLEEIKSAGLDEMIHMVEPAASAPAAVAPPQAPQPAPIPQAIPTPQPTSAPLQAPPRPVQNQPIPQPKPNPVVQATNQPAIAMPKPAPAQPQLAGGSPPLQTPAPKTLSPIELEAQADKSAAPPPPKPGQTVKPQAGNREQGLGTSSVSANAAPQQQSQPQQPSTPIQQPNQPPAQPKIPAAVGAAQISNQQSNLPKPQQTPAQQQPFSSPQGKPQQPQPTQPQPGLPTGQAGSKPVVSGNKPAAAPGEVFVDEQGNVHIVS